MTVQYYQEVLSAGPTAFLKLLLKWKGGLFKLIYVDFLVFSSLYALISCIYRFILKDNTKRQFENVVRYVYNSQSLIPVAFILGFYVSLVFGRFWNHFMTVPWITKAALLVASHLKGGPEEADDINARIQRRSIIRYLVASQILTLNRVSVSVKRRYSQMSDLYKTHILSEDEVSIINNTEPVNMQPFVPITWSTSIVMHANRQGRITNESVLINIIREINAFRRGLQELFLLDQMCVPLVYTQVVTLAVYSFFLSCLIGRQFILDDVTAKSTKDFFVPLFTILQFVVYMGWLKLALTLVNPMGEDDEDFDLLSIVDYNLEVGMAIVDNLNDNQPPFTKDKFFNQTKYKLPMETSMKDAKCKPFMGSVFDMKVDTENLGASLRSVIIGDNEENMSWTDEDTNGNISNRKGSMKLSRSLSNRKTSIYSLFHFNPIPILSEEGSSERLNLENEFESNDIIIQRSPNIERKAEKHPLVAIEEEDVSPAIESEMEVTKDEQLNDKLNNEDNASTKPSDDLVYKTSELLTINEDTADEAEEVPNINEE